MNEQETSISDQILDLLLEALQERQQQREAAPPIVAEVVVEKVAAEETAAADLLPSFAADMPEAAAAEETAAADLLPSFAADTPEPVLPVAATEPPPPAAAPVLWDGPPAADPLFFPEPEPPQPLPSIHLDQMLRRLALGLALLLIIINVPFNRYGANLARAMPDTAALVIRDGLLLKGSDEKVYVLQDNQLRWITTIDAFEAYGYRWELVHEVDDKFLTQFEAGLPIHLLLKCQASPHIYALEGGAKRWIKDIPTFTARGYVWEDVHMTSCDYLRRLPDGLPIPADAGPPPQP